MPGSTTRLALPYPLGTDPISDGDDQIKALAEKLDSMLGNVRTAQLSKVGSVTGIKPGSTWVGITSSNMTCTMSAAGLVLVKGDSDMSSIIGTGYIGHRINTDNPSMFYVYDPVTGSARQEFHSWTVMYLPAGATSFGVQVTNFADSASGFSWNATRWSVSALGGTPTLT